MHAPALRPMEPLSAFVKLATGWLLAALAGCASLPEASESDRINRSDWAMANTVPGQGSGSGWMHQKVGNRTPSSYAPAQHQGRPAIRAHSERGDSLIRLPLPQPGLPAGRLQFSWFVKALNPEADLQDRAKDDAVVRLILQFDGDRAPWSARDQRLSEWVQLATGEPLPHATLMYVWDPQRPVGTVLKHPRTDRIRLIVVESGPQRLGQWLDFERDIRADYVKAYGKPPQRLVGIGLMTDANNTEKVSEAWYGPLKWLDAGS